MQQTENAESFGRIVFRKRKALDLTQDQLAERCGGEPSKSYISQLENERKLQDGETPLRPSIAIVDALADALGEPRNYFRRLTGHRLIEDEEPPDVIAEEFAVALHRYRQLSGRSREFVQKQIRDTVSFLLEAEEANGPIAAAEETTLPTGQELRFKDPQDLPSITLDEARRRSEKGGEKE